MEISRYLQSGLILVVFLTLASVTSANEDMERGGERVGRWCDTAIPSMPEQDYIIEIWKSAGGEYSYRQLFKSKTSKPSANSYSAKKINQTWQIQNDHGEYVRLADDGGLRLHDSQGFIRKARPVGPNTNPGECRISNKKG